MNFSHARALLGGILGHPLLGPFAHDADERHLPVEHGDLDVRGVDVAVLAQRVADVLADALVRALVAARSAPGVRSRARATARALERRSAALGAPRRRIAPARARLVVAPVAFVDIAALAAAPPTPGATDMPPTGRVLRNAVR